MERRSTTVVVLVLTGHALVAAWTWRDIQQQPAQQVRGSKTLGVALREGEAAGCRVALARRTPRPPGVSA